MLKAALFDMDGLLFDTEAMYARLANEAARPLGFAFTEQMILDTLGVNETDCNAYYGSRIPAYRAETFWPAYHAAADRYVAEHGAPQKPYLLETLQRLHAAGVRMAVVSASPRADDCVTCAAPGRKRTLTPSSRAIWGCRASPDPICICAGRRWWACPSASAPCWRIRPTACARGATRARIPS